MSALPPKADIVGRNGDVRFVPIPEITRRGNYGSEVVLRTVDPVLLIDPLLRSLG